MTTNSSVPIFTFWSPLKFQNEREKVSVHLSSGGFSPSTMVPQGKFKSNDSSQFDVKMFPISQMFFIFSGFDAVKLL